MKHIFLTLGALANIVSAEAAVTSICTTSTYDVGTPHSVITGGYTIVTKYGSLIDSFLQKAISSSSVLQGQLFPAYANYIRGFQVQLYSLSSLNNADVADVIQLDVQLVNTLDALAHNTLALSSAGILGIAVYNIRNYISLQQSFVSSVIAASGGVSCDKVNSLNSVGSQLSSVFSVLGQTIPYSAYLTASTVTWQIVASTTCPLDCTTITLATTDTETSTTDSSTSTETSTSSSSTTSTETTSTTSTVDTTTSTDSSTSTVETTSTDSSSSTETISSRTVSGSIRRCIVRATSTTATPTSSTATPTIITVSD